jgi:putative flippase GtrA
MTPINKIIYHASRTEFTRYFFAGSLTFLTDFMVLLLLTEVVGINYLWSNLAAVSVGIALSYLFCVKWVFLNRRYNNVSIELPLFVLTCFTGVSLNELMLWVAVEFGNIHYLVSKVIVTGIVFVFNFYLKKILLFNK